MKHGGVSRRSFLAGLASAPALAFLFSKRQEPVKPTEIGQFYEEHDLEDVDRSNQTKMKAGEKIFIGDLVTVEHNKAFRADITSDKIAGVATSVVKDGYVYIL